jgi:NRAMP (natural resistance-associated macrophage protein)-like metal ion transporter
MARKVSGSTGAAAEIADTDVIPAVELGAREAASADAPNGFVRLLRILGPGITVGASDDDPSGIGTYAVAGAALGFSTLWMALVTLPMMASVQFISAKIGLITGEGLSAVLRKTYPRWVAISLAIALAIANTINAGADIGAIGAAFNLLIPHVPVAALVIPVGALLLALQMWGSYRIIANTFKWLALALFAYVAAAFFAHPNWGDVLRGTFVPKIELNADFITILVAILGTTISPYMMYWQASQEVEEDIALGRRLLWQRRGSTQTELRYASIDICTGMTFSNLVMYFIILATGATLFASGHHHIETAADAAKALVPLAGPWAEWLLALGLIGAGALAVPVLTASTAYALAGAFGWKEGLHRNPARAPEFYFTIAVGTLIGMEINYVGLSPVSALFWSAVINGVLAPFVLVALMLIANNRKILGEATNGPLLNVLGWATTVAMVGAAVCLFVFWGH